MMSVKHWFLVCLDTGLHCELESFPLRVGRADDNEIRVLSPFVSSHQFTLTKLLMGGLKMTNDTTRADATYVDGKPLTSPVVLSADAIHIIRVEDTYLALGTDSAACIAALRQINREMNREDQYFIARGTSYSGPYTEERLLALAEDGAITPDDILLPRTAITKSIRASELFDFTEEEESDALSVGGVGRATTSNHRVYPVDVPVLGESFACPYCRVVSGIDELLSVSVSPSLRGDAVLGEYEQARFLPTQFTANGLAVDAEGGVCTEVACPNCHLSFNQQLLRSEQIMMSVIGTAGAGKSVFLASSIWQCRHILSQKFGVGFFDLDPVANRWINAYEEKFFFQGDNDALQQIAKTDLNDANISRSVTINGGQMLLPLPSFFQLKARNGAKERTLVVYDSAGEHFRAGADTATSNMTLNMLNADVLYFMFDPSADPRFAPYLDKGLGSAGNYAQRQDILLSEMAARIRRHFGTRYKSKLDRPLILGVSKADLLKKHLMLDAEIYRKTSDGHHQLDLVELRKVSDATGVFLEKVVPEVVATARDITDEVWFLPVSSLGHNPKKEGVRPSEIKPMWAELPMVFTLARKGLVEAYNKK